MSKRLRNVAMALAIVSPIMLLGCGNSVKYNDGVYTVFGSDYNFYNHKPFLVVEVNKGKMVQALFDAVSKDGKLITENRTLKSAMLTEFNTSPFGIAKELTLNLLINQGTSKTLEASSHKEAAQLFKDMSDSLISEKIKSKDKSKLEIKTTEIKPTESK